MLRICNAPYLVLDEIPRVGRRYSVIEAAIGKKWDFEDFDLEQAHRAYTEIKE